MYPYYSIFEGHYCVLKAIFKENVCMVGIQAQFIFKGYHGALILSFN